MSLVVKVKTKSQVTIPGKLRQQLGIEEGDLLEAKVERGKITLTPTSIVDRRLAEALEDVKQGRTYGPFETADELIASLRANLKKRAKR
jgi:AbrB family looped-hinge helix DNA binding protein